MMIKAILLLCAASVVSGFVGRAGGCSGVQCHLNNNVVCNMSVEKDMAGHHWRTTSYDDGRRRALLLGAIALPPCWISLTQPSSAAKLRPDDAYASLVKAREELRFAGQTYLPKKDWEGLRSYLADDAVNMNSYDVSAQALLESKRLDAESKKDIGTIRRYGVGADVIIMYGGLKGEVDEENEDPSYAAVEKYLRRTADALDEVLTICRSNGFN